MTLDRLADRADEHPRELDHARLDLFEREAGGEPVLLASQAKRPTGVLCDIAPIAPQVRIVAPDPPADEPRHELVQPLPRHADENVGVGRPHDSERRDLDSAKPRFDQDQPQLGQLIVVSARRSVSSLGQCREKVIDDAELRRIDSIAIAPATRWLISQGRFLRPAPSARPSAATMAGVEAWVRASGIT